MTTINVPKALAEQFVALAKSCSDQMGNAGCNDWEMENTPENRELIELAEASNFGMTLEEYRESDEYSEPRVMSNGKLITCDFSIFDLFVNEVKKSREGGTQVKYAVCDAQKGFVIRYPQDKMGQKTDEVIFDSKDEAETEMENLQKTCSAKLAVFRIITIRQAL